MGEKMSKTKFTPGPWFVDADFYVYGGDGRKNQGEYFDGVEFPLVCDVESDSRDRTENKANAALIAAAPEMYEFIRWIRSVQGQCAIIKWRKFLPEILDKADEILHKAEGEE